MGTEVWAEARLVKTTLNGVPVWRADYTLNKDGVSLGFGGLLIPSAVESTHAGTEFFRFTDDPRQLRRIQAQVESLRQIIEAGQIADIQIASLEQGIKTSATVGVALPVAAVAAPAAGAAFSSTTIGITTTTVAGNVAAASLTGGISLGAGQASGEALIGGGAGDVAIAGLEGFAIGSVFSAPFGLAAPVGVSSAVTAEGIGATELSVAQTQSSIVRPSIRNLLPQRVARVIPGRGPFATLGRPGADDVFVTTVDDIAGLNPGQIAQRLGIPKSDVFTVIEFPTPATGLASPVFRDNPGFIGGGRTIGGAVEFVVPNGHIPPNAVIKVIGP